MTSYSMFSITVFSNRNTCNPIGVPTVGSMMSLFFSRGQPPQSQSGTTTARIMSRSGMLETFSHCPSCPVCFFGMATWLKNCACANSNGKIVSRDLMNDETAWLRSLTPLDLQCLWGFLSTLLCLLTVWGKLLSTMFVHSKLNKEFFSFLVRFCHLDHTATLAWNSVICLITAMICFARPIS